MKEVQNIGFREELETLTGKYMFRQCSDQIKTLKWKHEIKLAGSPDFSDSRTDCFKYVFDRILPSEFLDQYVVLAQRDPGKAKECVLRLISDGLLDLHEEVERGDRIAVYFKDDIPVHFGRIVSNERGDVKIESKWGAYEHVYRHGLWEVPVGYGDGVKFAGEYLNHNVLKNVLEIVRV